MQHVDLRWFRGVTTENQENFKKEVLSSKIVLDKLSEILYNMDVGLENVSASDYDSPSWSHKQAHINGERAALRKVKELITIKERDDPSPI